MAEGGSRSILGRAKDHTRALREAAARRGEWLDGEVGHARHSLVDRAVTLMEDVVATWKAARGKATQAASPIVSRRAANQAFARAREIQPNRTKRIFLVHGRDPAWRGVRDFLKEAGLSPIEFEDVADEGDHAAPYIGHVIEAAFENTQAVVVLFTPEELVELKEDLWLERDKLEPVNTTRWQARPNVLFEAGMALAHHPRSTVLVAFGQNVGLYSDICGREILHTDVDTPEFREKLLDRLRRVGCKARRSSVAPPAGGASR